MKIFVLKFDKTSDYPGELVSINPSCGGYPTPALNLQQVTSFASEEGALCYAGMFRPDDQHTRFAIEPKVHYLRASVTEDDPDEIRTSDGSRADGDQ